MEGWTWWRLRVTTRQYSLSEEFSLCTGEGDTCPLAHSELIFLRLFDRLEASYP